MSTLYTKFRPEQLPPAATFYRKEFPRLSRPSRGWARTTCPFHKGTNKTAFSVNLETGGFYCFNCGEKGGDILDFIQRRDHVSFKEAAQSLGAWDNRDLTAVERVQLRREREERDRRRQLEDDRARRQHEDRILFRDYLHALEGCFMTLAESASPALPDHPAFRAWQEFASWLLHEIAKYDEHYRRLAGLEAA